VDAKCVDAKQRATELVAEVRGVAATAQGWTRLLLERCASFVEKQAIVIELARQVQDCADHASNACVGWCAECRLGVQSRDLFEVALEGLETGPNGRA
jgi:hypothetical protein